MIGSLVFDLDGTLSDPVVGISRSIDAALVACGYQPVGIEVAATYIGPPLDVAFRSLAPNADSETVTTLVAKYRERYGQVGYAENVVYPGIEAALATLALHGVRMGVCTAKRADVAERILEMFRLRRYFAFVNGGDIGVSKASQLRRLLDDRTITSDATMIGDRAVDVLAAKQNGLTAVGVLWGHGSRHELLAAGPQRLLDVPAQLTDFVVA